MPRPSNQRQAERLAAALARLDPAERDVYLLAAVEGLSNAGTAARLGLTTDEVERLLASALCGLDRELDAPQRP